MNDTIDTTAPQEEQEIWKPIPNHFGYEVSNNGNVRSFKKIRAGEICKEPQTILNVVITPGGYRQVNLWSRSIPRTAKISNLVLEAFVGPRPNGFQCCHNNGIRDDDRLKNLRWDTPKGNCADRVLHGTDSAGYKNGRALIRDKQVCMIRLLYKDGYKTKDIADHFGITIPNVSAIVTGRNWQDAPGPTSRKRRKKMYPKRPFSEAIAEYCAIT